MNEAIQLFYAYILRKVQVNKEIRRPSDILFTRVLTLPMAAAGISMERGLSQNPRSPRSKAQIQIHSLEINSHTQALNGILIDFHIFSRRDLRFHSELFLSTCDYYKF